MRQILIADCHDSFVFNVVELLRAMDRCAVEIVSVEQAGAIDLSSYAGIVLSPGPSTPTHTEGLLPLVARCYTTHSVLGICLGHQALGAFFGAEPVQLEHPRHGYGEQLIDVAADELLFRAYHGTKVARYHSWIVDEATLPQTLQITARAASDHTIMALRHKDLPLRSVQFHPESYLSEEGFAMLAAWVSSMPDK